MTAANEEETSSTTSWMILNTREEAGEWRKDDLETITMNFMILDLINISFCDKIFFVKAYFLWYFKSA